MSDSPPIIAYADPAIPTGRWPWWAILGYVLVAAGLAAAGKVVWQSYYFYTIWPREAVSWCGSGRLGIHFRVGQMPYLIALTVVGSLPWSHNRWLRRAGLGGAVVAAIAFAIVLTRTGAYFRGPEWRTFVLWRWT